MRDIPHCSEGLIEFVQPHLSVHKGSISSLHKIKCSRYTVVRWHCRCIPEPPRVFYKHHRDAVLSFLWFEHVESHRWQLCFYFYFIGSSAGLCLRCVIKIDPNIKKSPECLQLEKEEVLSSGLCSHSSTARGRRRDGVNSLTRCSEYSSKHSEQTDRGDCLPTADPHWSLPPSASPHCMKTGDYLILWLKIYGCLLWIF